MKTQEEYLNISDLLHMNVKELNDEDEIRVRDFSYEKYICSLEMGDKKLDVGIKPEKRINIKECEDKKYITQDINLHDMIIIMDNLLLQQVKLLLGNHPFLTVLSCYFIHNSKVINCDENPYFFEKIFYKWIKSFCSDSTYMNIFENDNKEFMKFVKANDLEGNVETSAKRHILDMENGNITTSTHGNTNDLMEDTYISHQINTAKVSNHCDKLNEKDVMFDDEFLNKNMFSFFQLFLIFYSSTSEVIDHVVTSNSLLHRDDYKCGLLKIKDSLIHHCRERRRYVLKNLFLVKRYFLKFLKKYEFTHVKGKERKSMNKDTSQSVDQVGGKIGGNSGKLISYVFKRIKFVIYLNSIINEVIFESREMNPASVIDNCKELLQCILNIKKEVDSECVKRDKVIMKKYFNKYLLMHKLNNVSKHITKMSIHECYSFYQNITLDIEYIAKYFQLINAKSSFIDIKNMLHYIKYYSASRNVLIKSISRVYLQQILENAKENFINLEKELLFMEQTKVKYFIQNYEINTHQDSCHNSCNGSLHGAHTTGSSNENGGKNEPFEKRENPLYDSIISNSATKDELMNSALVDGELSDCQWGDYDEHPNVGHYYSMFLNTYRKEETCEVASDVASGVVSIKILNKEFLKNVRKNVFITFFLHLFFNESYVILEDVYKENTTFYVKSIIFNDLRYFGFSTPLIILLRNFFLIPDTFFIAMEHIYHLDKGLNFQNEEEYKNILENTFPPWVLKKLACELRLSFPCLINYLEKENSLGKLFTELEQFIANWGGKKGYVEIAQGGFPLLDNSNHLDSRNRQRSSNGSVDVHGSEKAGSGDEQIEQSSPEYVTKRRMNLLILCKVFHLFIEYLEIVLKKILKFSFLLAPREHSKLSTFHMDMCVLYTLMKILTYYFRLYNMNKEIESVENYFNCILHTVLIDYNCLSLYTNMQTDQEYAFTYYAMSLCCKELSAILQRGIKLSCDKNRNKLIYSLFYYILYLYSDFLMIYFIYISYTNINSECLEEDSFDMKYKVWNFCYPDVSKIDFYNFQKNKAILINLLLTKNLKISLSENGKINIGVKKKIKNISQVKDNFFNSKKLIDKYSNLLNDKNYINHSFRIFGKTTSDLDINTYLKSCINEIAKLIKDAFSYKQENIGLLCIFLKSYEHNLLRSYKNIPPFCVENISIFLNPDYQVVNGHSYFLSVEEKKKKKKT
ncbi:hypothetical protein, conserved [Plasmodium gonderi]|uniref:NAA35-like N-terminal domain-containing protein n=1 Tax=Plasmodium gonderi TaxID=77519 RepID=A0A1Y1JCD2_PLAGO|nr:hypothetical protein, conserved [Plasmodium gonderi]GAW80179.1 hypothetical protein, conserved [Plasmodium gonderi]